MPRKHFIGYPKTAYEKIEGRTNLGYDYDAIVLDNMKDAGYPIWTSCCPNSTPLNGQTLIYNSSNKRLEFGTIDEGSGNINLGYTPAANYGTITNSGGLDATIPLATNALSGLINSAQFIKLANTSGVNTGDVSVTNSGSIAFNLTGQSLTAFLSGINSASIGQVPSKGINNSLVWTTITSGGSGNTTIIDSVPVDGSNNAVSSNGVFDALFTKVDKSSYNAKGTVLVGGASSIVAVPVGINGTTLIADSAEPGGIKWSNSPTNTSSKYAITMVGTSITCMVYGTPGITAIKLNNATISFTIPQGGYLENYQVYYPGSENPGVNCNHIFNYISNTLTNQNVVNADVPVVLAWFASGTPSEIYYAKSVGSANEFVTSIVSVSGGNLNMHINFGTTGLATGEIVIKGIF